MILAGSSDLCTDKRFSKVIVGESTPVLDQDEIQEAKWFSIKEALLLENLLPITHNTIKKIQGAIDIV